MAKVIRCRVRRASGHALVAFLGMSAPAFAQSDMTGTWSGTVAQNEGSSGYAVVMTVTAAAATTDYPSLKCGGTLSRVGSAGGYVFYTETITHGRLDQGGRCIDGTITITPAQGKLAWGWFGAFQGKALNGYALLIRRP
jgi:hypothetical protein